MESITAKRYFLNMPHGFSSLFFTQLFSTISFAVLYATLVLYMKEQLQFSSAQANLITGVYFACNFALHLLSGYLGGRFFSYRGLVMTGILFQLIGCIILTNGTLSSLYWGLSYMLVGSGTMITCLNMLVSQLFDANDTQKRQSGFLWNYSGMNFGFMFGFTLAGYFQLHVNYTMLFLITAANNMVALIVLLSQWKLMGDHNTILSRSEKTIRIYRYVMGSVMILALLPILNWLLRHTDFSDHLVLVVGAIVAIALVIIACRNTNAERRKLFAFIILLLSAQIFWIIYQLAPMGLTLFAKYNVDRHVFGFLIAPGWIQNINSVTIIIGAPLLGVLFVALQKQLRSPLLPLQYGAGLILSAIGLFVLPIGIAYNHHGYTAFIWLFITYVLQAIAELCISPIGYSMVGQLVPTRWQSICMGSTLLNSGVAAVLASYFSNYALGSSGSHDPLITNASYSHSFNQLGGLTILVAIILFAITPWLNRLIRDH